MSYQSRFLLSFHSSNLSMLVMSAFIVTRWLLKLQHHIITRIKNSQSVKERSKQKQNNLSQRFSTLPHLCLPFTGLNHLLNIKLDKEEQKFPLPAENGSLRSDNRGTCSLPYATKWTKWGFCLHGRERNDYNQQLFAQLTNSMIYNRFWKVRTLSNHSFIHLFNEYLLSNYCVTSPSLIYQWTKYNSKPHGIYILEEDNKCDK